MEWTETGNKNPVGWPHYDWRLVPNAKTAVGKKELQESLRAYTNWMQQTDSINK